MPVTTVSKDADALTMTIVVDFSVPVERLWNAYVDPRQIEKFWGPPSWPATFPRHDFAPGGRSAYYMTGPEGEQSHGYWEFEGVDVGRSFVVKDGFSHADGTPNNDLPSMRMEFRFEPIDGGSRLVTTTYFNSAEELEQLLEMGMEEGTREAMSQIDQVLAAPQAFPTERVDVQLLSDTTVRITRMIRSPQERVWEAYQNPELIRQWMLGPDGWTMIDCQVPDRAGEQYRLEWRNDDSGESFAFVGEVLELVPPYRYVTTEAMEGADSSTNLNEQTLVPVPGGTLNVTVITYPSLEQRDMILGLGMTDGMEHSYARLETLLE